MAHVSVLVKMEIECRVNLPAGYEHHGLACDDPAIEAALAGLPQDCEVFLWGMKSPPVKLYYEAHEEDCTVEEDDRGDWAE